MIRALPRSLLAGLLVLTGLLTLVPAATAVRKPTDLAVSSPEGGELRVCRDGILFQLWTGQTPSDAPRPTEPFRANDFTVYSPPPVLDPTAGTISGGTVIAQGRLQVPLAPQRQEVEGDFYDYLITYSTPYANGQQIEPGPERLVLDVGGSRFSLFPAYPVEDCYLYRDAVTIDVEPRDPLNRVRLRWPFLPVALLSSPGFDAAGVAVDSVRFGATGTEARAFFPRLRDVDGDGDRDLVLSFLTRRTGLACGDVSATLRGRTRAGRAFADSDAITTVGCRRR